MLISVIIPVYNRISSLKRAIESVLCQNEKNYEILIVDDGSTLNIEKAIYLYLKNPKIKYFKIYRNKGVSFARNTGIKESKGNFIALLDSDDLWLPFKLKVQLEEMEKQRESYIIFTDEFWLKNGIFLNKPSNKLKLDGEIYINILDKCRVSPSTVLINKRVFEKIGFFNEHLRVCEDYEFFLRASLFFKFNLIDIKSIIKISESDDQLSKNIKYIEYIRLNILLNMLKKYGYYMSDKYKNYTINEINRKFSIVRRGINKL
jgi:glycosyltransferase involved in cell wall biosynthesis